MRLGGFRFAAGSEDALDAAAPGFDFPGSEKNMGNGGIVWGGGMRAEEFFKSPAFRKGAGVPNGESVGVNADLNWSRDGVIAVDEGVEDGFAQGGIGHGVAFDAMDALVGDGSLEILGLQEVDGAGGEGEEVALEGVVVGQIGFGAEVADFHEGSGNEFLGVFVEKKHGSALEVGTFGELKFFDEGGFGRAHVFGSDATGSAGETAEPADRAAREIRHFDAGHGNAVPSAAMAAQQESVERETFEFLQGASAALVVMASIADGVGIGIDDDFQPRKAVLLVRGNCDEDAESIANFVWNVLQKLRGVLQSDDEAIVIATQVENAALGVRKATDPAKKVIPPCFFPFEMLVFLHVKGIRH